MSVERCSRGGDIGRYNDHEAEGDTRVHVNIKWRPLKRGMGGGGYMSSQWFAI